MSAPRNTRRLMELSARIFGELMVPKDSPNGRVVQRLAMKPVYKLNEYSSDYYPRQQDHDHLFKVLRSYGLYRDEHQDFLEEIQRLKKLRGKTIRVSRRTAGFWSQLGGSAKPAATAAEEEEAAGKPAEEAKKK